MGKDYYAVLGVSKDATEDQLKKVRSFPSRAVCQTYLEVGKVTSLKSRDLVCRHTASWP